MRRTIIILTVLLFAGSAYAVEPSRHLAGDGPVAAGLQPYPVDLQCIADPSRPAEAAFCEVFRIRLVATGMFEFDIDVSRPYFMIIVLPTVRDSYYSVTVASNFIYPPLAGLALSAYLSSYIITPGQAEELDRCATFMVNKNLIGISEWMVWFEEKVGIVNQKPRALEVRND